MDRQYFCNKLTFQLQSSQCSCHNIITLSPMGEKKHTLTQCDIQAISTINHLHKGPCCLSFVRHLTWCTLSTACSDERPTEASRSIWKSLVWQIKQGAETKSGKLYRSEGGQTWGGDYNLFHLVLLGEWHIPLSSAICCLLSGNFTTSHRRSTQSLGTKQGDTVIPPVDNILQD